MPGTVAATRVMDEAIITFLNRFAHHSTLLDGAAWFLTGNNLLKGGVLMCFVWWAWFAWHDDAARRRASVMATLVGCIAAIGAGRAAALLLPFRQRPLHDPSLGFDAPDWANRAVLEGWSSMPSDHAVLFFAFATGMCFVSRAVGSVALLYSSLLIALPRVYVGLHYPSDILAGAIIGILIGVAANASLARTALIRRGVEWGEACPALFCPLLFVLTFQITEMFASSRGMLAACRQLVQVLSE